MRGSERKLVTEEVVIHETLGNPDPSHFGKEDLSSLTSNHVLNHLFCLQHPSPYSQSMVGDDSTSRSPTPTPVDLRSLDGDTTLWESRESMILGTVVVLPNLHLYLRVVYVRPDVPKEE